MGLDMTAFDAGLKDHYTHDRVEDMVYKQNPALALLPKMENFGGRKLPIVLAYGNPQGRSRDFTQAKARGAATSSRLKDFELTRVKNYSIATIDNETLEASKGDVNAFVEAATTEIDGAINSLTNDHGFEIFRGGYGSRGVIGSISTNDVTLEDPEDVVNFELDMQIVFAASEDGDALRDSGEALTISAINRTTGVLTFSSAVSGVSGAAAGDHMFVKGDREDSSSPARTKISGFMSWLPWTAPTSGDSFFNVDRSVDVVRLAGHRKDLSAMPIEEALIDAETLVAREGGRIDHFFINFTQMASLKKALGAKVQYVDMVANPRISFRGVMLDGNYGPIRVIADRSCPIGRGFGVHLAMWKLYSLGKAVRVIDTDGPQMLRQNDADGVEVRYGAYLNMGCRAPRDGIHVKLG